MSSQRVRKKEARGGHGGRPGIAATPWTLAHQAPLSMEFSRQECWSGLPSPSPGDLPNPGIEPRSPALKADSLQGSHQGSLSRGYITTQLTDEETEPLRGKSVNPKQGQAQIHVFNFSVFFRTPLMIKMMLLSQKHKPPPQQDHSKSTSKWLL